MTSVLTKPAETPPVSAASHRVQVLLATCGAWWLSHTAKAFAERGALAAFWITMGNHTKVPNYKRCWPFQALMLPLYQWAPQIWGEHAFYFLFPIWKTWLLRQRIPKCNVVQTILGYGTELYDAADRTGALKVADCPNSHPVSYYGFMQRECDVWCPGENVPIPRWMFARMNRELDRADLIVVQSDFCKDSMVLNGIPEEKVMVNIMGVNTSIFKKRERVPEKPRFVCVGTICLRKGHQYLFRAFQKVKKVIPDAELICVGDYKVDFRLERPKWHGTFTHYPALTHPELTKVLQGCSAFVFPSQEEGIARAQIEALASGLPVIGTYAGGATTLVRDGIEGFIVPSRDPDKLADAMIRIVQDKELNRRMGDAAYLKGAVRNTWQDYGDRLLAEYERRLDLRVAASTR